MRDKMARMALDELVHVLGGSGIRDIHYYESIKEVSVPALLPTYAQMDRIEKKVALLARTLGYEIHEQGLSIGKIANAGQ